MASVARGAFRKLVPRALGVALLGGVAVAVAVDAGADSSPAACKPHAELAPERLLRRLSIDLRGVVPDVSEYDQVKGVDDIPDAVIDAYLASDAFRVQMRRYHESLLWTNPSAILTSVFFGLGTTTFPSGNKVFHVTSSAQRKLYRGGDGTHACIDKPQSDFANGGYDPVTGAVVTEPQGNDPVGPVVADGWVEVHPYWDPDPNAKIKVCAFDAQATETYTLPPGDADAGEHTCDEALAEGKSKSCGCGPALAYCMVNSVQQPILDAMREQLLRVVDDHTTGGAPYSELLTTKRAYVNGPLVHYFKYLAARQTTVRVQDMYRPEDGPLPDLGYLQKDDWVAVDRAFPHAGILTLPAFLLRFQTNRGRANRYRIAFEGQYFEPPSTKDSACDAEGEDLTRRCVCRNCHSTLEPLAAFFGKFTEAGTMSMHTFTTAFDTQKACAKSGPLMSNAWCDRFYVPVANEVDPDIRPYTLKPLRYADAAHPLIEPHFDAGPAGLAKEDIDSGTFHKIATRQLFEFLMKREPNLDPTSPDSEIAILDALATDFRAHDDLRKLVKAIVSLPAYRRAP